MWTPPTSRRSVGRLDEWMSWPTFGCHGQGCPKHAHDCWSLSSLTRIHVVRVCVWGGGLCQHQIFSRGPLPWQSGHRQLWDEVGKLAAVCPSVRLLAWVTT